MRFYKVLRVLLYIPLNLLFLFRVRYIGSKHMPKSGPVIVCCNHLSVLDPVLLGMLFHRPVCFMAKAEAFESKFGGWIMRRMGAFPVRRGEADMEAVKTGLRILKNGGVMGIFPEGHRQKDEANTDNAHNGIAMFAAMTDAVVLPCSLTTEDGRIKFLHKVTVKAGNPLTCEQLGIVKRDKDSYYCASAKIMNIIYAQRDSERF